MRIPTASADGELAALVRHPTTGLDWSDDFDDDEEWLPDLDGLRAAWDLPRREAPVPDLASDSGSVGSEEPESEDRLVHVTDGVCWKEENSGSGGEFWEFKLVS